jgi:hypothetical protein
MPDLTNKLVVAVVEREQTRIWTTDAERGSKPERIGQPANAAKHKHVREAQHHGGHDSSKADKAYYEAISDALSDAGEILLVGHGNGKANAMFNFISHIERHHPEVARKISGALDINVQAMTEPEILAAARKWFDEPIHAR